MLLHEFYKSLREFHMLSHEFHMLSHEFLIWSSDHDLVIHVITQIRWSAMIHSWPVLCPASPQARRKGSSSKILKCLFTETTLFFLHSGVPSSPSDFFNFMGHVYIRHQTVDPDIKKPILLHCRFVWALHTFWESGLGQLRMSAHLA